MSPLGLDEGTARRLAEDRTILWHQRFELGAGVVSPGVHDIAELVRRIGLPEELRGQSVLDVGTCNGFAAFEAERRGASRVVAVDIYDPDRFGFDRLHEALHSSVEFVKASVYGLPDVLGERFDHVLFLGVLYHLRHPLLAVDALLRLTAGTLYLETALHPAEGTEAAFFPGAELAEDASNWWAPTVACLRAWLQTSGFVVDAEEAWPAERPLRGFVVAHPSPEPPLYRTTSYELPLRVAADGP